MQAKPHFYYELDNIIHASAEDKARCICLFSPCGAAGVSSLTLSLAARYRDGATRILVLDLNHQNPMSSRIFSHQAGAQAWQFDTISTQLNVNSDEGVHYLSITELTYADALHDVSVINDAVARWRQEFDYILIDLSPLLNADMAAVPAAIFAQVAQMTLLVVSAGETTEEQVVSAHKKLADLNFNNVQLVMSQIKMPPLGPILAKKILAIRYLPATIKHKLITLLHSQQWLFRPIGG